MRRRYSGRLGIPPPPLSVCTPEFLDSLLRANFRGIPFENLRQFLHPAEGKWPAVAPVPDEDRLAVLEDARRAAELVLGKEGEDGARGGFCFELNLAFGWLLQQYGFQVRLVMAMTASSSCAYPGSHVVPLVRIGGAEWLADAGFGVLPFGAIRFPSAEELSTLCCTDQHGATYTYAPHPSLSGGITLLRAGFTAAFASAPGPAAAPLPQYHVFPDEPATVPAMTAGMKHVLRDAPDFTQKRIVVLANDRGYVLLSNSRVRVVRDAVVVEEVPVDGEAEFRHQLETRFGIQL